MNKNIFVLQIVIFSLVSACQAQQLVVKKSDLPILEKKQEKYVNQPLIKLLKNIGPEIKTVLGMPASQRIGQLGTLIFHFVSDKEYQKQKEKGVTPISIIVYVKEDFEWERRKLPLDKRGTWTSEDEKKYGNLTVLAIKVFGEVTE